MPSEAQLRAAKQALQSWILGMTLATPTIAVFQGMSMLRAFRNDHLDAPHPEMPARGMVVVRENNNDTKQQQQQQQQEQQQQLQHQQGKPPLRLLIIGDSLAAGVGVTKSVTPILPESIARGLSKGLNGRAVSWTCMGTPGNNLPQTLQEMSDIDEDRLSQRKLAQLKKQMTIWWEQRKKRLEDLWEKEKQKEELEKQLQQEKEKQQAAEQTPTTPDEIVNTIKQNITQTTEKSTNRLTLMWNGLQQDIKELRELLFQPKSEETTDDSEEGTDSTKLQGKDSNKKHNKDLALLTARGQNTQQLLRRRTTTWIDPGLFTQYDVTVVVTGLNDIKSVFLPQEMLRSAMQSLKVGDDEELDQVSGIKRDFMSALGVLRGKIRERFPQLKRITDTFDNIDQQEDDKNSNNSGQKDKDDDGKQQPKEKESSLDKTKTTRTTTAGGHKKRRYPALMVFPAFPYFPPGAAPLSWFMWPLCVMIDENKRLLAKKYPGRVVFVEMLAFRDKSDYEQQKGRFWNARTEESVLLNLQDIKDHARERAETVYQEYYQTWTKTAVEHPDDSMYSYDWMEIGLANAGKVPIFSTSRNSGEPPVGLSLINHDKFHPNDDGYEIWGRHIAEAILKEWGL